MSKRARPGHVSLTLEIPIEVAEWFAANADGIAYHLQVAALKARNQNQERKVATSAERKERQAKFTKLGRDGYRALRRVGVRKNFPKNREVLQCVASEFGVDRQHFESAVTRFKRTFDAKCKKRLHREVERLYWRGAKNETIAQRFSIHRNTVVKIVREIKKRTGRRA